MIPVAEALERVLALALPLPAEPVPLARAVGRVLAEPAVATRSQPPFAASAMDGWAVTEGAVAGDSLKIIGQSRAGERFSGKVNPGEAVRIFTGAPVPEGTARVVMQENAEADEDLVTLREVSQGRNIRPEGSDFAAGFRIEAPCRLKPADLALLAAMNVARPMVARRPVVALIATGDELVMPGEVPGPDQIVASNVVALAAMAEAEGAEVRILPIARDNEAALEHVIGLAADADLIVTIGGASVGDHDLVGKVAADMGLARSFYKIAMRPGKPLMAGRLGESTLLGLPGNPVSSIVCAILFMLPLLRAMQGLPDPAPRLHRARLAGDTPANGPRAHYMRARLTAGGPLPLIEPFDNQDSGALRLLSGADALLLRPPHDPARKAGEEVEYLPL